MADQTNPYESQIQTGQPQIKFTPGGFWRRLVAYFIDSFIVNIAVAPLTILNMWITVFVLNNEILYQLTNATLNFIIIFLYAGFFYSKKGSTPGKMVMGLRVVDANTGQNISFGRAGVRDTFGKIVSTITLLVGYLMIAFRDDKKGLHDLMSSTQVMHKEN